MRLSSGFISRMVCQLKSIFGLKYKQKYIKCIPILVTVKKILFESIKTDKLKTQKRSGEDVENDKHCCY